MPAERLTSFPTEPLRHATTQPTIANPHSVEKNGQFYFWDNILEFPDSWRQRTPKTGSLTTKNENCAQGINNDKQLHFWDELAVPSNYAERNKDFWRKAKRGIGSNPLELPNIAHFIHERMVKTFDLDNAVEPILSWSILYDRAQTPSAKYVYEERVPDEVPEEDADSYIVGMARITEYATNHAVKLFLERNLDFPFLKEASSAYAKITDLLTYAIIINGTYRRMTSVELTAKKNGKDFDQAITEALFKHDLSQLDTLVGDTKEQSGWNGLADLAIEIGDKKWKKPDLAKWTDKLEVENNNGHIKTGAKSVIASVAAGGVTRSPGVSEVSGGMMAVLLAEATIAATIVYGSVAANHPEAINLIAETVVTDLLYSPLPIILLTPALILHEMIHTYSFDESNYGLIPATLVHDEKVPYLARLQKKTKTT